MASKRRKLSDSASIPTSPGRIHRALDGRYFIVVPEDVPDDEVHLSLRNGSVATRTRYSNLASKAYTSKTLCEVELNRDNCKSKQASPRVDIMKHDNLSHLQGLCVHGSLLREVPVLADVVQCNSSCFLFLCSNCSLWTIDDDLPKHQKDVIMSCDSVEFGPPGSIWALASTLLLLEGVVSVEGWLGRWRCDPALPAQTLVVWALYVLLQTCP